MDLILAREPVDLQECDVLIAGLFQDERPLKGTAGWIDWRLNGHLSRLALKNQLTGDWKETTLISGNRRITPKLILLVGLGKTREYSTFRLRDLLHHLLETLKNLRTPSICLSLPFEKEGFNVECGKLTEIFLEGVAEGLDRWPETPDGEWARRLRLFVEEGERHVSEILLGVKAAQSVLQDRIAVRVLIPSEGKTGAASVDARQL